MVEMYVIDQTQIIKKSIWMTVMTSVIIGVNGVIKTHPNSDLVYVDTCVSAGLFILSDLVYSHLLKKRLIVLQV